MKILIIGGVAGGATVATRLRRLNEKDEIIVVEQGDYISFANCGLPYHIGGSIAERQKLLLQTAPGMKAKYNLDIRLQSRVESIDPHGHTVVIRDLVKNQDYQENFDKLIISTGAKAIIPPIPGIEQAQNLFTLRNVPDMDAIKAYLTKNEVKRVAVIGGGFIGLEMVENLTELGLQVDLVEMAPQVMPNLDFEMAQEIHAHLQQQGVGLHLHDGLNRIEQDGHLLHLNSGTKLATDLIILSIGVLPESTLAKEAGLELGVKGAIKVDSNFQTSAQDIYAIGDVIEVPSSIDGQASHIPLAWPANRQARLLADHLNGLPIKHPGSLGTSIAKIFSLSVASTGLNERQLQDRHIPYHVIHTHPSSHAGYYPGASPMHLKLIFGQDGRILGAQAVGSQGVDKRIDILATAIHFGAKAPELAGIEVAYAPPYASAKDPVNHLGYIADNLLHHRVETIQWHEVDSLLEQGAFFLDVREESELANGHLAKFYQIPLGQLRQRLAELPSDQPIYVYCQVGLRGYQASRILTAYGFTVKNLDGGYKTYRAASFKQI
ncbi:FAD-dependent oxidoreductase [Vaginisenegalia massiliensis]|uniref:FAD-dependent oxidoreductase n=1 Tax=Vaginisenegalia massiliensis TaxID=2058294 RepID=UPI000F521CC7|nr:FAD-dependent oxidoreductase [Vaginisenegalia massiliensis]